MYTYRVTERNYCPVTEICAVAAEITFACRPASSNPPI